MSKLLANVLFTKSRLKEKLYNNLKRNNIIVNSLVFVFTIFLFATTANATNHDIDLNSDWKISKTEINLFISSYSNNDNNIITGNGDITEGVITMREVIRAIHLYNNGGKYAIKSDSIDGFSQEYILNINSGSSNKSNYIAGDVINVSANAPEKGEHFVRWISSDGGSFDNNNHSTTNFVVPSNNATISAVYENNTNFFGINFSGAEFGHKDPLPGKHGAQYIYPGNIEIDHFSNKGFKFVRLPFKWKRMQKTLYGELDSEELGHMQDFIDLASTSGMSVILDLHSHDCLYDGFLLGSTETPQEAFIDLWEKLAEHFKDEDTIYGFGLLNEPHGDVDLIWADLAQNSVNAIREIDMNHKIFIAGKHYSNAHIWPEKNGDILVEDPANNIAYEAHIYFDDNYGGWYDEGESIDNYAVNDLEIETVLENRIAPFVNWCKENEVEGFIGEYGVPNDLSWRPLLDGFLTYLDANNISSTAWSAGAMWGEYILSLQPNEDETDKFSVIKIIEFIGN